MQRPLVGLTRSNLVRELLGGVTLLAIAVPLNIGYAQIAGLPATAGLYALVVPAVLWALLASSRQLVVSPDAAAAALVASSLTGLAAAGSDAYLAMAAAQAVIGGVMFFACSAFKLGFLANFLSKPILIGFVGGLALDVFVSQIAKMLGVKIDSGAEFFDKLGELLSGLGGTVPWSLAISLGAIAVLVAGRRIAPVVPWALLVLIVATVLTVALSLPDKGVDVLGEVEAGPPRFIWPDLDLNTWLVLVPSAFALTFVAVAEGLLVSRKYAEQHRYPNEPNRDLFAFGASNLAAGVTGSFTIGSSTSRTAAVDAAGSRTQLPSLVAAAGTLLLLIFGTALLEDVPSPVIGAIVAVAVFKLIGLLELRELFSASRFEFVVGIACFAGVLFVGPIGGILIAFVLSLVNLANRAAHPAVDVLSPENEPLGRFAQAPPATQTAPGVVVLRFAAPIFFANAQGFGDAVRAAVGAATDPVRELVLDMEAVTDLDVTGADAVSESREWLESHGVRLSYSRVRGDLRAKLEHFGLWDGIPVYASNRAAVTALGPPRGEAEAAPPAD